MTERNIPRLRMFAGPNGSGKTTLAYRLAREFSADGYFNLCQFINADELLEKLISEQSIDFHDYDLRIERADFIAAVRDIGRLAPSHPFLESVALVDSRLKAPTSVCDSYVAAAIGDFIREELLDCGQSFSFETVMSHESKIEFLERARAAGYRTYLYFIATDSADVNVHRIETRVESGGHAVPREKVVQRYRRSLLFAGDAATCAYRSFFFDNSGSEPIWLAQVTPEHELELKVPALSLPNWFQKSVLPRFENQIDTAE